MKHFYKYLLVVVLSLAIFQNRTFSQSFHVDTLLYHGEMDYYINLVILGDGFLESDLPDFRAYAESYVGELFMTEPFERFENFFNAFSISVPSNEQGASLDPDNLIDNYFGSTFNYAGIERLLVATRTSSITTVLANNLPEYDQIFILVNSTKYGGSGGWAPTASLHEDSKEIALHELGHSFAGLIDEYWVGDQYAKEGINMTQETDLDLLRWRNWHGDNDVGLFAHSESPSWYRPHQNCLMRYLGEPFCSVCREGIIEQIYSMATPFRGYEPGITTFDMTSDSVVFKLALTNPEPNTLKRNWYLNETLIGKNVDSVNLRPIDLVIGVNKILASVSDTSIWIRPYDNENYHQTEVEWTVNSTQVGSEPHAEILSHSAVSIYPNPVHDILNLRILGDQHGEAWITLYDTQGRQVRSYMEKYPGNHSLELNSLESGLYVLIIHLDGGAHYTRKIIKH